MVDPTTANIQLAIPTRGSDVGTWDVPVNGNMSVVDGALGGILTIGLNNSSVVLSSAQFINKQIIFNSTLTGSVSIAFPTSFIKSYEILNSCTGSSAFTITLLSGAGQVVCAPPGEIVDIVNDGTNIKYKNLGRVGSYWDYAGSSLPNWVSGCTVPPYLNCDGTTFSSATYPTLALILGGNTLPNSQGKYRVTLNQSASSPITSSQAGLSASAVGNIGGAQNITLGTSHLPANIPINDPGHNHNAHSGGVQVVAGAGVLSISAGAPLSSAGASSFGSVDTATTGITVNPSSLAANASFTLLPPTYVGGMTLIRAA